MDLTGKAKKQFEEWFAELVNSDTSGYLDDIIFIMSTQTYSFSDLPDPMKWGVYVDFFDSVGVNISVLPYWEGRYVRGFEPSIYEDGKTPLTLYQQDDVFTTRPEARIAAIEKANEIVNNR